MLNAGCQVRVRDRRALRGEGACAGGLKECVYYMMNVMKVMCKSVTCAVRALR